MYVYFIYKYKNCAAWETAAFPLNFLLTTYNDHDASDVDEERV
jgi:hypothetical protein